MDTEEEPVQLSKLESLKKDVESKLKDFNEALSRSKDALSSEMESLRKMIDLAENSINKEIEHIFEKNKFAEALIRLEEFDEKIPESEIEKFQKLIDEDIPFQLGPSKLDYINVQKAIIKLNSWSVKKSTNLPEHIEGKPSGVDCIELKWDEVGEAIGYHVEVRNPSQGEFHRVFEGSDTEFKLSKLCSDTRMLFRLRSVLRDGSVSKWSECIEASTLANTPQYICAEGKSESEISVCWDKVNTLGDEAPIYHVEMRPRNQKSGGGFEEIYSGSETRYTARGLGSKMEYLFCVKTMCGDKCVNQSSVVSGWTKIPVPRKFQVRTNNGDSIDILWDSVISKTGETMNYVVEMKEGSNTNFIEIYSGTRTKIRKTKFKPSTEYSFRVRSKCGTDMSEWSSIEKVKTSDTPVPDNITLKSDSRESIHLSWDKIASDEGEPVNYIVEMMNENDHKFVEVYRGTESNFKKLDLKQNTECSFRVRSLINNELSIWSNVIKGKTQKDLFMYSEWKKCPDDIDDGMKYSNDVNNPRIATIIGNRFCTIISNTPLPLDRVTSWSVKILRSKNDNGAGIYIGVAPSDIDIKEENSGKCGWYFHCHNSTLYSGPPHNRRNLEYSLASGSVCVHSGDIVGVSMDTLKGDLSFNVNNGTSGVAYTLIPLDKPLVPCVILIIKGDSIELII